MCTRMDFRIVKMSPITYIDIKCRYQNLFGKDYSDWYLHEAAEFVAISGSMAI